MYTKDNILSVARFSAFFARAFFVADFANISLGSKKKTDGESEFLRPFCRRRERRCILIKSD